MKLECHALIAACDVDWCVFECGFVILRFQELLESFVLEFDLDFDEVASDEVLQLGERDHEQAHEDHVEERQLDDHEREVDVGEVGEQFAQPLHKLPGLGYFDVEWLILWL